MEKSEKVLVFPEVEEKHSGRLTPAHRPFAQGWDFTREELMEKLEDGTHKLLTLDISISDEEYVKGVNAQFGVLNADDFSNFAEESYNCDIGCSHCFECKTSTSHLLMTTEEVFKTLLEAKELGLKAVKFLGPGELLHNPKLFEILDFLKEHDIQIGIFTKGIILGDDELSRKAFGMSSKELCEKLQSYENVSILLGFTSADQATEEKRIDSQKVKSFFLKRNAGLKHLVEAGFVGSPDKQRLTLVCAPVLRDNIDEVLEIYKWALERGIPTVVAPTMVSGKGGDMPEITDPEFKEKALVGLYVEIYHFLITEGVMTLEQIEEEGVSPYAGKPCNQFISGMFIRKDGRVQSCPGNEGDNFDCADDVREESLKEIWKRSLGYSLREKLASEGAITITQPCYAKTEGIEFPGGEILVHEGEGSIPADFYKKVLAGIQARILGTIQ